MRGNRGAQRPPRLVSAVDAPPARTARSLARSLTLAPGPGRRGRAAGSRRTLIATGLRCQSPSSASVGSLLVLRAAESRGGVVSSRPGTAERPRRGRKRAAALSAMSGRAGRAARGVEAFRYCQFASGRAGWCRGWNGGETFEGFFGFGTMVYIAKIGRSFPIRSPKRIDIILMG